MRVKQRIGMRYLHDLPNTFVNGAGNTASEMRTFFPEDMREELIEQMPVMRSAVWLQEILDQNRTGDLDRRVKSAWLGTKDLRVDMDLMQAYCHCRENAFSPNGEQLSR